MAILNDMGQQVSFKCTELIEDVRGDIQHLRRTKKVSVACRVKAGVKIVFDYAIDKDEEKRIQLADDEWMEAMTLGQLLAYAIRQNRLTVSPGSFDSVSELFDASGMPMSSFGNFFGVPPRTMQDWIYGASPCPQYVINLMAYKLEHENKI